MSEKLNKRNQVFQADELSLLDSLLYKYRNVLEINTRVLSKYHKNLNTGVPIFTKEFNVASLKITVSYLNSVTHSKIW